MMQTNTENGLHRIHASRYFNFHRSKHQGNKCFFILIGPGKVNGMKTSRASDNSINVTCNSPYEINGPQARYILEVKSGGSLVKTFNQSTCKFVVDNLYYSTDYEFLVRSCVP